MITQEVSRYQDVPSALMRGGLVVEYESVIVRGNPDTPITIGELTLVGINEGQADGILDYLKVDDADVRASLDQAEINPKGLYVVQRPQADDAMRILARDHRAGTNGVARILCR